MPMQPMHKESAIRQIRETGGHIRATGPRIHPRIPEGSHQPQALPTSTHIVAPSRGVQVRGWIGQNGLFVTAMRQWSEHERWRPGFPCVDPLRLVPGYRSGNSQTQSALRHVWCRAHSAEQADLSNRTRAPSAAARHLRRGTPGWRRDSPLSSWIELRATDFGPSTQCGTGIYCRAIGSVCTTSLALGWRDDMGDSSSFRCWLVHPRSCVGGLSWSGAIRPCMRR